MFRRIARLISVAIVLVLATFVRADGQTYQGGVRGQARDQNGVLPGADVTLTNEETNGARTAMTNNVGEYAFASVLPGTYTVEVALPGFKTEDRKGIRIGTQQ